MRQLSFKQWIAFALLLTLPLFFQNCGNGGFMKLQDIGMNEASSYDSFFDYPYNSKPDQFVNLQLVQSPAAMKFSSFVVFAAVADPNAGANGNPGAMPFQIRVLDSMNVVVCPTQSGTFQPSQTSIQFSCTPAAQVNAIKIELNFTAGGTARSRVYSFQ